MEKDLFEMVVKDRQSRDLAEVMACNEKTEIFGLALTPEEAGELVASKNETLKKYHRVEFGASILSKLVYQFCDSQYIGQEDYLETLTQLQDVFYQFKNEAQDEVTDDELLVFMREQFDEVCFGDVEYLADTCLARFAQAVRAGYDGFIATGGRGVYQEMSQEQRWDKELYMQVLRDLCWK